MTPEEKAKAYDKALEKARKYHAAAKSINDFAATRYEDIFPELRKEEKPLTPFQQCLSCILRGVYYAEVPYKEVKEFILKVVRARTDELVELAKKHDQKEQKPEQSFEDWVDGWFKEHKEKAYPQITMDEKEFKNFCRGIKNMYEQKPVEKPDLVAELKHHLATTPKEQLEKEWKELEYWGNIGPTVQEFLYGKPVEWNQEDKKMLNRIIETLSLPPIYDTKACARMVSWLKSFPERFVLQPKAEWSEEDEKVWEALYKHFSVLYPGNSQFRDTKLSNRQITNFLKSLRPQPKQEWSMDKYNDAMSFADKFEEGYEAGVYDTKRKQWKPTEEQMEAFHTVLYQPQYISNSDDERLKQAESLYEQLKKL